MSNDNIEPEERIARRWRERLGLQFPCEIQEVVKQFADIEETLLPFSAEAVLFSNPKTRKRPIIFLDPFLHPNRKTFTLAHELGHLLIPWHAGTFMCWPTTSLEDRAVGEFLHEGLEREANRFAAEFLLPSETIQSFYDSGKTPGAILKVTNAADISNIATSFKLLKTLPGGYLMAELDTKRLVKLSGKTRSTYLDAPPVGVPLDVKTYSSMGAIIETIEGGMNSIVWIDVRNTKVDAPSTQGLASATSIIRSILNDLGREDCLPQINGIVGAGNAIMKKCGKGDLYTVLSKRFEGRDGLEDVISHPDFRKFLAKRAEEIAAKI